MKENNFNKYIDVIINSYEPLKDWFDRNKVSLELVKNNKIDNYDLIVFKKMVDAVYRWINMSNEMGISYHARAFNASEAILQIYKDEYEKLSNEALELYYINNHRQNSRIVLGKNGQL